MSDGGGNGQVNGQDSPTEHGKGCGRMNAWAEARPGWEKSMGVTCSDCGERLPDDSMSELAKRVPCLGAVDD